MITVGMMVVTTLQVSITGRSSPEAVFYGGEVTTTTSIVKILNSLLVKTSFCGEWNLEFGSNTTEKFEICIEQEVANISKL